MKILQTFFWMTVGAVYAMLFARRSGKELRKDLSNSYRKGESVLNVLWEECKNVELGALKDIKESVKDNKNIQDLVEKSKLEIQKATEIAKKKGGDIAEDMVSVLKSISKDASQKANEISRELTGKAIKGSREIQDKVKKRVNKSKK